jgi:hypothetical protein
MSRILLVILLLTGCSTKPIPELIHPTFMVHIHESPELLESNVNGTAKWLYIGDVRYCIINLRQYPRCLLHEIRHCSEGHWHNPMIPNSQDC